MFSGETFEGERCPDHYDPFGAPKTLTTDKIEELAKLLRAYAS